MNIKKIISPKLKIENHMVLAGVNSEILKNDGHEDFHLLLHSTDELTGKTYLQMLTDGTRDADIPFSGGYICHMKHFHHPWSHRGYLSRTSSADTTAKLFTIAANNWQAGSKHKAIYHLGRALHLVQDIFVPHHAGITAFKGHGQLEQWLLDNWKDYQVQNGGYYNWNKNFCNAQGTCHQVMSTNIYDWIDYGSHISIDWYNTFFAEGRYSEDDFKEIAPLIIPNVLRLSAGLIHKFFSQIDI